MRTIGPFAPCSRTIGLAMRAQAVPVARLLACSGPSRAGAEGASPAISESPRARTCSAGSPPRPTSSARTSGPGTLEAWGIGPAQLDPRLVWVRISAFGQDGPYSKRPGLDRLGIAYGGLLNLTGEPDRPPVRPGVTVSDYLTGVFAAEAALAALYRRDARRNGHRGRHRRFALRIGAADPRVDDRGLRPARHGAPAVRGTELANSAPLDNYPTADGRFVCIVGARTPTSPGFAGRWSVPTCRRDPRFATLADRAAHTATRSTGSCRTGRSSARAAEVEAGVHRGRRAGGHGVLGRGDRFGSRTSPSAATSSTSTIPSSGTSVSRPLSPGSSASPARPDRRPRARAGTTVRSGATWSGSASTSSLDCRRKA